MDIQPIFTSISRPYPLPSMPHKSCAFCGSVFITESECESCGRQFHKESLGAPGGEKSFYATRERYRRDVGKFLAHFDYFLARDASLRTRYLSLLKKRYVTLLDHFQQPGRGALGSHAYLIEFRDLVIEMRRMHIDSEYMFDMVELGEGTPLMPKLLSILNEEFSGIGVGSLSKLLRWRISNGPRLGFLFAMVFGYGGLCFAALVIFSYLAKR